MKKNAGFTLVELMVTIAIMGITIAAVPAFKSWRTITETNTAVRVLAQDLRLARSVAVDRTVDTIVTIDAANNSYSVYIDYDNDGAQVYDLDKTVSLSELGSGVAFNATASLGVDGEALTSPIMLTIGGSPPSITFRPNGQATNPGAVYLLSNRDTSEAQRERSRAVQILSTGKVLTYRWTGENPSDPWTVFY